MTEEEEQLRLLANTNLGDTPVEALGMRIRWDQVTGRVYINGKECGVDGNSVIPLIRDYVDPIQ